MNGPVAKAGRLKAVPAEPDDEGTRATILNAALQEFVRHGLSGARIDAIAAESCSNKGMIYYDFGGKEAPWRRWRRCSNGPARPSTTTLS